VVRANAAKLLCGEVEKRHYPIPPPVGFADLQRKTPPFPLMQASRKRRHFSLPDSVGWRWDVGFVALLVGTGVLDGPETNGYLKPHGVCGMNGNKIVGGDVQGDP